MKITYRLSNRQRKELYVRQRPLLIALPIADARDVERDPLRWAAKLLPDVDETIQQAEIQQVAVTLPPTARDGLAAVLGTLLHGGHDQPRGIVVNMSVLAVWLSHGDPRHAQALMQWPGAALIDGKSMFGAADDSADAG